MPKYDNWERKSGLKAYQYYDRNDPEFEIVINGKPENFVKVFRVDKTLHASIITDIDYCSTRSPETIELLESFVSFVDDRRSDFSISLGDNLSHRLRDCSKYYREDFPELKNHLTQTKSPDYWVLGDHDVASSADSYRFWLEQTGHDPTYYSFDVKGIHVIVLDTVTGGEPLVKTCDESPSCKAAFQEKTLLNTLSRDRKRLSGYLEETGGNYQKFSTEQRAAQARYAQELLIIKTVRDANDRDKGMVLDRELAWLENDLSQTKHQRVVVFSDHPLFPFTSHRKSYDIVNGEKVRNILETSSKDIVAISGEAHLWHEEERNGIRYFIVDQLGNANGSWAFLSWPENREASFERITH